MPWNITNSCIIFLYGYATAVKVSINYLRFSCLITIFRYYFAFLRNSSAELNVMVWKHNYYCRWDLKSIAKPPPPHGTHLIWFVKLSSRVRIFCSLQMRWDSQSLNNIHHIQIAFVPAPPKNSLSWHKTVPINTSLGSQSAVNEREWSGGWVPVSTYYPPPT